MAKKLKHSVLNIRLDCYHHFIDFDNNLLFDLEEISNEVSEETSQTSRKETSFPENKKYFREPRRN